MTDTLFPPDAANDIAPLCTPPTRPISMTAHSVHGIQKDLKTQTRRVIYPQPKTSQDTTLSFVDGRWTDGADVYRCPYGAPGDQLWVREMWARVEPYPDVDEDYGLPISWRIGKDPILLEYWRKRVVLLADFPDKQPEECGRGASDNQWRSPVTMPRWASRLLLEVTEVRAERVQEISAKDCQAEGINVYENTRLIPPEAERIGDAIYRDQFSLLWNSINGEKNPWAANPWVWAISFRRIEPL